MELSWGKCAISFPRLTCGKTCTAIHWTQAFQISPLASGPLLCQLSVPLKYFLYAFEHHKALTAVEMSHRKAVLWDVALPLEGKLQPRHELFMVVAQDPSPQSQQKAWSAHFTALAEVDPPLLKITLTLLQGQSSLPCSTHPEPHMPRTEGQESAKEELMFTCKVNIKSLHYCALLFPVSASTNAQN